MGLTLAIVGIYLAIGLLFGVVFAFRGARAIDPAADGSSLGFRLLILPGCAALWPMLAWRWISKSSRPPTESNAHRRRTRHLGAGPNHRHRHP
ncbi:hypothetical protein BH23VER1_BH23VER1_11460 [soil metagenome]